MGVLWQLVVSRRYGRSRYAPEKEKERLDEALVRRGKPRGAVSTWSCFIAEVWLLFLLHSSCSCVY